MNRGSQEIVRRGEIERAASMRPRFMNRGSASGGRFLPGGGGGFNEAPIHESGKSVGRGRLEDESTSFNEAPIHESGKSRSPPRASGCGSGFNEAPIHESGK